MKTLGKQNTPTIRKALKTLLKKGTLVKEGASYRLKHATSAKAKDVLLRAQVNRVQKAQAKARHAVKMERRYLKNAQEAGGLSKRAKENVLWLKEPPSPTATSSPHEVWLRASLAGTFLSQEASGLLRTAVGRLRVPFFSARPKARLRIVLMMYTYSILQCKRFFEMRLTCSKTTCPGWYRASRFRTLPRARVGI